MASDVTRRLTLVEVPLRTSMAEDMFVSVSMAQVQVGAWRRAMGRCGACLMCMHCASFPRHPSCSPCCLSHLRACDVMRSPESSRAAMFGVTDACRVWVWIVLRRIVEPCLEDFSSRSPLAWGRR
jgi:hypothetical protein